MRAAMSTIRSLSPKPTQPEWYCVDTSAPEYVHGKPAHLRSATKRYAHHRLGIAAHRLGGGRRSSRFTRQMLTAEIHFSPALSTMTCSSVSSVNRLPAASVVTGREIPDALANALRAFSRPNLSANGSVNWRGKAVTVAKLGRQRVGCAPWPPEQAKISGPTTWVLLWLFGI